MLLPAPELRGDRADGRAVLGELDGRCENVAEGELAAAVARDHVLPRRARAGDHDAQRVGGGRDLGSEVPALSTEVEGERGGGGAAAHDRGDILGRRVVAKREGVAADAGARGFAHVQRRGDRDGGVKGVASRSQDAEARLGGEGLRGRDHAARGDRGAASPLELDRGGALAP